MHTRTMHAGTSALATMHTHTHSTRTAPTHANLTLLGDTAMMKFSTHLDCAALVN
jgi:hypothetical protein